jgi:uncharacterized protein with GYD domain
MDGELNSKHALLHKKAFPHPAAVDVLKFEKAFLRLKEVTNAYLSDSVAVDRSGHPKRERIRETPRPWEKRLKEMGGEIKAFYLTTGTYDMLAVVDVPSDEILAAYLLWLGSQGNLRTQTVRAFTEDEYRNIVGGLT